MPFMAEKLPALLLLIAQDPAHVSADFTSHAAKVDAARPALNSAFMVGHGTLRMTVMGHHRRGRGHCRASGPLWRRLYRPHA
jgi:N-acyl-D-aspartate/D-glutamate deacylase